MDEFYCISPENGNISLFYYPNIGYNIINLFIKVNNNSSYIPEKLQTLIVSETDLIDHNNKSDPIGMAYIYHLTSSYSSLEYTNINYNFQYLQYESDDGYFYKNTEILNGMAFSDMNFYMSRKEDYNFEEDSKNSIDSIIGAITFQTNKSYYDSYKRSYQRMQSLLAEVMSVISLVFEIGRQISKFLCEKKMSKDIVSSSLDKDKKLILSIKNKRISNSSRNIKIKELSSERKKIKPESFGKTNIEENLVKNDEIKLNESKCNGIHVIKTVRKKNIINKILEQINYFHIIKSFLCFKDKKTELINLYHNIIIEDMCVEKIIGRFYNLDRIYQNFFHEEKEKINIVQNKELKGINEYTYKIHKEIKNENDLREEKNNNDLDNKNEAE